MSIPQHIAIIMDGNGRWARKRKLPRVMGHRSGVKAVQAITEACARLGVKMLTLYTFSTENWKRPKNEVDALMELLEEGLKEQSEKIHNNNIRINVIGNVDRLSEKLREGIEKLVRKTSSNTGMMLTLALNYGGRQEILDAVKKLCRKSREENLDVSSWGEEDFNKYLYTGGMPDPDLVIRTSGQNRLSNFLLWQSAYSEFYVTDCLWPDFNRDELERAIKEYQGRERRFGG